MNRDFSEININPLEDLSKNKLLFGTETDPLDSVYPGSGGVTGDISLRMEAERPDRPLLEPAPVPEENEIALANKASSSDDIREDSDLLIGNVRTGEFDALTNHQSASDGAANLLGLSFNNERDNVRTIASVDAETVEIGEPVVDGEFGIPMWKVPGLDILDKPLEIADGVLFLGMGPSPDEVFQNVPDNEIAADTTNADQLWSRGGLGLNLDGSGVTVGVWDSGHILDTHQEFGARVRLGDATGRKKDHATHVGGTIGAAGRVPKARGMANQVNLISYDSKNDLSEMDTAANNGLILSNHSYGSYTGWTTEKDWGEDYGEVDTWLGVRDPESYNGEAQEFGLYTEKTKSLDEVLFDNPYLLSVWSAGNDRNDSFTNSRGDNHYVTALEQRLPGTEWVGHSGGHDYYLVPTNILEAPLGDGNGNTGYDTLPPRKNAKNTLVVGAVNGRDVSMTSFSSWGPTDDGRIKPDVVLAA